MKRFKVLYIFALVACFAATASPQLVPHRVVLASAKSISLNLPADLEIVPAVEGLKRVRFFARSPDGRIFVTDMHDLTDNNRGAVYILDGWDGEKGKFAGVSPYLTGLKNPNSVQFHRDTDGQEWLYVAETDKITRRKFARGEMHPSDPEPQTIATFPDYGLSYKYGGWHLTRTLAFAPNGKLYVSVGSSCNSCEEKEKVRASVIEMNPNGTDVRQFASGLRNAVGLKAIGKFIWASNQGSDQLGRNRPDETFYALKDGADYGWPYCHSSNGHIFADPKLRRPGGCSSVAVPYASFPAHSSALGFDYFDEADAPDVLKNAFLVALHGATDKRVGHGYKIVSVRKGQRPRDLVTGFLQSRTVVGRPCDIMKLDANSFLFTDDHTGVVYYVRKKGWTSRIAALPEAEHEAAPARINAEAKLPVAPAGNGSCLSLAFVVFGAIVRLFI